jgi:ilvC: ketol-acid reductoisomerase
MQCYHRSLWRKQILEESRRTGIWSVHICRSC